MQTVNWKIVRFTSKKLADKSNPLVLRVNVNGKRKHWSLLNYRPDNLKLSANYKNWDETSSGYSKIKDPRNNTLKTIKRRIENYLEKIAVNKELFTFSGLEQSVFVQVDGTSFYSLIEAHINSLKQQNRLGYQRTFKDAFSAVKRFTKDKDFELTTLDKNWSIKFATFLAEEGCNKNTISIYLRNVQRIYNKAKENNIVKDELNFVIPSEETKKRALSKDEMLAIVNANVSGSMRDSHNYIAFSFYTGGMNFMDLAFLRWNLNIQGDYIVYERKKTINQKRTKKLTIKITPKVRSILDYYKDSNGYQPNGYIFPIIIDLRIKEGVKHSRIKNARKKTNKHLRIIAKDLEVKDANKISFYSIRHTFASVLLKNGRPIELISEAMGHKDIRTTQIYLDGLDQEVLDKAYEEDLY